jgi:hypothetical protein
VHFSKDWDSDLAVGRCAQDTTNSVWCFARLFHYPGAELLQAISLYCLRHWHRFKAQELANMIWSLALLRACSADTWCACFGSLTHPPLLILVKGLPKGCLGFPSLSSALHTEPVMSSTRGFAC